MFTIQQIKEVHAKVKSGKDFPAFIQDIIKLGVERYENFVSDGHTSYYGSNGFKTSSDSRYSSLSVSVKSNIFQFKNVLKAHQQGNTDYMTFCKDSAGAGVEKWIVDTSKMTCIYYDKEGNEMLAELIPTS